MRNIESEHSNTQPKSSKVTLFAEVQSPIASTSKSPMIWKKATVSDLKRPVTEELLSHWLKRQTCNSTTSEPICGQYAPLAKLKQEVFEAEKTYRKRKQAREEILFELEKTKSVTIEKTAGTCL
ncbi:hypothetical protein JTB14_004559 [Gonioctena quinquepunctata]|nr:hypothetical protein JTB14_004559 [Gonioctena quinquepunctata]